MWGDYAMARIEPGNRVDRFLAGVAYLDGRHPSAVFARGYYTRTTLVAYRWDGQRLQRGLVRRQRLGADDQPVQRHPHGRDGTDPRVRHLTTQGVHSLSVADVDGDGKQEIVYGAATIDHDGSLLYCSFGDAAAGQRRTRAARAGSATATRMHVDRHRPRPARAWRSTWCTRAARSPRTASRCATPRPAR